MVRHHGVKAAHFLHHTHILPGLEGRVHGHAHDFDAIACLPGRKFVLTNAPRAYADRVLGVLGIARLFDGVLAIEDMNMFGQLRPKPDARMLRRVGGQLGVPASRCVLVEDTLGPPEGGAAHRHGHRMDAALGAQAAKDPSRTQGKLVFTCTASPHTCVQESLRSNSCSRTACRDVRPAR